MIVVLMLTLLNTIVLRCEKRDTAIAPYKSIVVFR
jgi:hypothetical protein